MIHQKMGVDGAGIEWCIIGYSGPVLMLPTPSCPACLAERAERVVNAARDVTECRTNLAKIDPTSFYVYIDMSAWKKLVAELEAFGKYKNGEK